MMRYDIMHFEALGKEAEFLKNITEELQKERFIACFFYLFDYAVDYPRVPERKYS